MLLMRTAWATIDVPIFAVVQHFCLHRGKLVIQFYDCNSNKLVVGVSAVYHNIYCRIVRNPVTRIRVSRDSLHGIGEDDWFKTEIPPLDHVISSPRGLGRAPHVTTVGKSGQGTIKDFRRHLLNSKQGRQPPHHALKCYNEIDDRLLRIKRTPISLGYLHISLPGTNNSPPLYPVLDMDCTEWLHFFAIVLERKLRKLLRKPGLGRSSSAPARYSCSRLSTSFWNFRGYWDKISKITEKIHASLDAPLNFVAASTRIQQ